MSSSRFAGPIPSQQSGLGASLSEFVDRAAPDMRSRAASVAQSSEARSLAAAGVASATSPLPHGETIQRAFGPAHDLSGVRAALDSPEASAIEAQAYTLGEGVAFAGAPDLRLAAHEAAHVVQQQAGWAPSNESVDGEAQERHADSVAERVASGLPAGDLLGSMTGASAASPQPVVQRKPAPPSTLSKADEERIKNWLKGTPPTPAPEQTQSPPGSSSGCTAPADVQEAAKRDTFLHGFAQDMRALALRSLALTRIQSKAQRDAITLGKPQIPPAEMLALARQLRAADQAEEQADQAIKDRDKARGEGQSCETLPALSDLEDKKKYAKNSRALWALKHPLLGRVSPAELARCLAAGDDEAQANALYAATNAEALKVEADVAKTEANLRDGTLDPWDLASIVAGTIQSKGIKDPQQLGWIQGRAQFNATRKAVLGVAAAALQLGLLAVAGPIGGLAGLSLRAIAFGVGVLDAHLATRDYFAKQAATNTALAKHESLFSEKELGQQGLWLGLAWLGVALDAADIVRVIKALRGGKSPTQAAAEAGGRIPEAVVADGKRFLDGVTPAGGASKPALGGTAGNLAKGSLPHGTKSIGDILSGSKANFIVGDPIASEALGHNLLQRLAAGDAGALSLVGAQVSGFDPRMFEWGLGRTASGQHVLVRGSPMAVNWGGLETSHGIVALAHSHPFQAERALVPVGGSWRINDMLREDNNVLFLFPSGGDLQFCQMKGLARHEVHTPYLYNPATQTLGNPTGATGATVSFVISNVRETTMSHGFAAYTADLVASAGGQVIWRGPAYAPNVGGYVASLTLSP